MKARVTQTDVARVAGVHNTTVSLALRNCPAIPEATRKRIQGIAEEMGYYPDPALQALVAYRNGRMPNRRVETIAYVTNWSTRWGWQDLPAEAKFHAGAQRKAAQCGYQLEHFWFGEPEMSQRRLSSMLFHRGINGVILASHRHDCDAFAEMDWSRLSAVKIGCFPHAPALHRVTPDQSAAVRLAIKRIQAAGYQRTGIVMPYGWDDFADQAWSGGFLGEQYRLPPQARIPILMYGPRDERARAMDRCATAVEMPLLEEWVHRWQPDVIVSAAAFVRNQIEKLGLSVPRDIAYVDLFLDGAERGVAGVRENCERVGEIATELLIAKMQQNVCGVPAVPTSTLVEGVWVDGESLPPLQTHSRWSDDGRTSSRYSDQSLLAVP